jgi:predicted ester cyclase
MGSAFSDLDYSIDDMIAEGDKVSWRFTMRGKHTGPFMGMQATNRNFTITGMSLVRVDDEMLAEHWGEQDMLGTMKRLQG